MGRKLGKKKRLVNMDDHWHAFIATPAYDGKVDSDYAMSLSNASFCAPLFQVKATISVMGNGAFIDLARNTFVKMFLEQEEFKECTHLFFIDSDLKFDANAFIGLIRSGHPVVAGVYPRRQTPADYPVKFAPHPEQGGLWLEDDWIMAERVPTGFLCIRRDIIEEMAKEATQLKIHGQDGPVPQLFYTRVDEEGRFVGEDYCFCDDYVKKYQEPIRVWGNIDFVHGGYEGNLIEWLDDQIDKEEEEDRSVA